MAARLHPPAAGFTAQGEVIEAPASPALQLLELTQEHIRPLIAMIDRLNEADAKHELRE